MRTLLAQRITLSFVIGTCLVHVLCCGLPLLLSITSLTTLLGLTGIDALHKGVEPYEEMLMQLSAALLVVTGVVQYVAHRIDCRRDGACEHTPCDTKKRLSLKIYLATLAIFMVNVLVHELTH